MSPEETAKKARVVARFFRDVAEDASRYHSALVTDGVIRDIKADRMADLAELVEQIVRNQHQT